MLGSHEATSAPPFGSPRPRLRGVLHAVAFFVAVVVGSVFVAAADGSRVGAAAVFAVAAALMLGASALYHRFSWGPRSLLWMRRVDHAGIYLLIAGSYTSVGLLTLHGTLRDVVLAIVWSGAVVAIVMKLCWVTAPNWVSASIAVLLGWVGVAAFPQITQNAGIPAVTLFAVGGAAYTVGAVVYARQRPDPFPHVFGYHELFHALTLVALACQYVAMAFFVVRVA